MGASVRVDAIYSSDQLGFGFDFQTKAQGGVYFGDKDLAFGVVGLFEPLHLYVYDHGGGVAAKFGHRDFWQVGVGGVRRTFTNPTPGADLETIKYDGFYTGVQWGTFISHNLGISLNLYYKSLGGDDRSHRTEVSIYPAICWEVGV